MSRNILMKFIQINTFINIHKTSVENVLSYPLEHCLWSNHILNSFKNFNARNCERQNNINGNVLSIFKSCYIYVEDLQRLSVEYNVSQKNRPNELINDPL